MVVVEDADDPRLDPFRWRERRLARGDRGSDDSDRRETVGAGLFVAEGDLVVARAIAAGCEPVAVLCAPWAEENAAALVADRAPVYGADDAVRRNVTGLGVPLEIVGLFRRPSPGDPERLCAASSRVAVLEGVDNPTNVGAVVRSAAALGWDALLLDATSADPLSRRALRVSMGLGVMLPAARMPAGDRSDELLRRLGFRMVALTPSPDALPITDFVDDGGPLALMLGSERHGLSADAMDSADLRLRIPMRGGVDSLNVAAAAAIAMHVLGSVRPA